MIKAKFVEWAFDAIRKYLEENGDELFEKVLAWIESMLKGSTEETFACPKCPEGCEEFCNAQMETFNAIRSEA